MIIRYFGQKQLNTVLAVTAAEVTGDVGSPYSESGFVFCFLPILPASPAPFLPPALKPNFLAWNNLESRAHTQPWWALKRALSRLRVDTVTKLRKSFFFTSWRLSLGSDVTSAPAQGRAPERRVEDCVWRGAITPTIFYKKTFVLKIQTLILSHFHLFPLYTRSFHLYGTFHTRNVRFTTKRSQNCRKHHCKLGIKNVL